MTRNPARSRKNQYWARNVYAWYMCCGKKIAPFGNWWAIPTNLISTRKIRKIYNPPKYAPMAPVNYHHNNHHIPFKNMSKPGLGSSNSLSNCFNPRHLWPMVLEAAPSACPYTIGILRRKAFQKLCMDPRQLIRRFPAVIVDHIRDFQGWRTIGPKIMHLHVTRGAKGGLCLV